jgi:lysophospholipase L1-like esterase
MRIKRSVGLLVLVFALLWVAVLSARHEYGEKVAAKVWPLTGFAPPLVDMAYPGTNTVLLLGDSRVAAWGRPEIDGWRVLNAGVPGITSGELAMSCGRILDQTRPQLVIIEVGINDLKLLGVQPDLRDAVVGGCVSNIVATVQQCRRYGARVVVSPVWPVGPLTLSRRIVWSGAVGPALEETNARLVEQVAQSGTVSLVDLFAKLSGPGEERASLYRDTLHLKPECYARLSSWLAEVVKERGGDGRAEQGRPGY